MDSTAAAKQQELHQLDLPASEVDSQVVLAFAAVRHRTGSAVEVKAHRTKSAEKCCRRAAVVGLHTEAEEETTMAQRETTEQAELRIEAGAKPAVVQMASAAVVVDLAVGRLVP